ncbi:MAG: hypothetical protein ABMA13_19010 [Chthoniobacteraceae bacterium]
MKIHALSLAFALAFSGCHLARMDRSYSLEAADAQGRTVRVGLTLHPRDAKEIKPLEGAAQCCDPHTFTVVDADGRSRVLSVDEHGIHEVTTP